MPSVRDREETRSIWHVNAISSCLSSHTAFEEKNRSHIVLRFKFNNTAVDQTHIHRAHTQIHILNRLSSSRCEIPSITCIGTAAQPNECYGTFSV